MHLQLQLLCDAIMVYGLEVLGGALQAIAPKPSIGSTAERALNTHSLFLSVLGEALNPTENACPSHS